MTNQFCIFENPEAEQVACPACLSRLPVHVEDSRFFPGYTWCSFDANCLSGLCMPTANEQLAARMFAKHDNWIHRGKQFTVYTMTAADAQPTKHTITIGEVAYV